MSGKYGSSSFSVLLVDGYDLIGAKPKGITFKVESKMERSDGLGDSWEATSPTGIKVASLSQDGAFFDDTTNGMHSALSASQGTSRVMSFATTGNTIGARFVGLEGTYGASYDVLGQIGGLTKANAGYQVSGRLDRGLIIQHQTAKTADWNTKTLSTTVDYTTDTSQQVIPITSNSIANPSVVTTPIPHGLTTGDVILIAGVSTSSPTINGERTVTVISTTTFSVPVNVTVAGTGGTFVRANTIGGAVGYMQVSAFSGFTGFVGKLRHSIDDTTYTDLITFSNVTAGPTAQRSTATGTINRYICFDGDVTGTGSITVFVGLSRL